MNMAVLMAEKFSTAQHVQLRLHHQMSKEYRTQGNEIITGYDKIIKEFNHIHKVRVL